MFSLGFEDDEEGDGDSSLVTSNCAISTRSIGFDFVGGIGGLSADSSMSRTLTADSSNDTLEFSLFAGEDFAKLRAARAKALGR